MQITYEWDTLQDKDGQWTIRARPSDDPYSTTYYVDCGPEEVESRAKALLALALEAPRWQRIGVVNTTMARVEELQDEALASLALIRSSYEIRGAAKMLAMQAVQPRKR